MCVRNVYSMRMCLLYLLCMARGGWGLCVWHNICIRHVTALNFEVNIQFSVNTNTQNILYTKSQKQICITLMNESVTINIYLYDTQILYRHALHHTHIHTSHKCFKQGSGRIRIYSCKVIKRSYSHFTKLL